MHPLPLSSLALALLALCPLPLLAQNTAAPPADAEEAAWIAALAERVEGLPHGPVDLLADNLAHWQGDLEHHRLNEDGELEVLQGARHLSTKELLGNFVFSFEFKLTPGANNGIGLRVPPEGGDPAYAGMEIQVLDDTAEQYASLRPDQYHGGLYGLKAARRGVLRPVGEWNSETIVLAGRELRVILNGQLITSANLDEVSPIDDHDHPGLARSDGRLVLCGHGDAMTYRNLKLSVIQDDGAALLAAADQASTAPAIARADGEPNNGRITQDEYDRLRARRHEIVERVGEAAQAPVMIREIVATSDAPSSGDGAEPRVVADPPDTAPNTVPGPGGEGRVSEDAEPAEVTEGAELPPGTVPGPGGRGAVSEDAEPAEVEEGAEMPPGTVPGPDGDGAVSEDAEPAGQDAIPVEER